MKVQQLCVAVALVIVGVLALAGPALAQGVGNLGSLPTTFTTGTPANGWTVISSTGAIPVSLNPTGPVWGKSFVGPNGGNFFYPPTSGTNPPLPVTEVLQVAGNLPWTDWHEDVMGIDQFGFPDPGWSWGPNTTILIGGLPAPGLTFTGVGTGNLSFFFNPVLPGTTINVRKELVYTGLPGATFVGTLAVHEYPTGVPEPGTLAILGLGATLAVRHRRRARSIALLS
jgi:hypothetical protein